MSTKEVITTKIKSVQRGYDLTTNSKKDFVADSG